MHEKLVGLRVVTWITHLPESVGASGESIGHRGIASQQGRAALPKGQQFPLRKPKYTTDAEGRGIEILPGSAAVMTGCHCLPPIRSFAFPRLNIGNQR